MAQSATPNSEPSQQRTNHLQRPSFRQRVSPRKLRGLALVKITPPSLRLGGCPRGGGGGRRGTVKRKITGGSTVTIIIIRADAMRGGRAAERLYDAVARCNYHGRP